ncbi:MAG: hypothetical protein S4CHLAM102_15160 [Chlamydiia bacterium]|nr:hypothetical protein [Chlamydiia bacterium]
MQTLTPNCLSPFIPCFSVGEKPAECELRVSNAALSAIHEAGEHAASGGVLERVWNWIVDQLASLFSCFFTPADSDPLVNLERKQGSKPTLLSNPNPIAAFGERAFPNQGDLIGGIDRDLRGGYPVYFNGNYYNSTPGHSASELLAAIGEPSLLYFCSQGAGNQGYYPILSQQLVPHGLLLQSESDDGFDLEAGTRLTKEECPTHIEKDKSAFVVQTKFYHQVIDSTTFDQQGKIEVTQVTHFNATNPQQSKTSFQWKILTDC